MGYISPIAFGITCLSVCMWVRISGQMARSLGGCSAQQAFHFEPGDGGCSFSGKLASVSLPRHVARKLQAIGCLPTHRNIPTYLHTHNPTPTYLHLHIYICGQFVHGNTSLTLRDCEQILQLVGDLSPAVTSFGKSLLKDFSHAQSASCQ